MFYINKDGVTLGAGTIAIIGGEYGGCNGTLYGSFANVGETVYYKQVAIIGTNYGRFVNGIKASAADTKIHTIYVAGISFASITNQYVDQMSASGYSIIHGTLTNTTSGYNYPTLFSYYVDAFRIILRASAASAVNLNGANVAVADDGYYYISSAIVAAAAGKGNLIGFTISGAVGEGFAHEAAIISVGGNAGTPQPIIVSGTTNVVLTDTDTKVCILVSGGPTIGIRNRLGATMNLRIFIVS